MIDKLSPSSAWPFSMRDEATMRPWDRISNLRVLLKLQRGKTVLLFLKGCFKAYTAI